MVGVTAVRLVHCNYSKRGLYRVSVSARDWSRDIEDAIRYRVLGCAV